MTAIPERSGSRGTFLPVAVSTIIQLGPRRSDREGSIGSRLGSSPSWMSYLAHLRDSGPGRSDLRTDKGFGATECTGT